MIKSTMSLLILVLLNCGIVKADWKENVAEDRLPKVVRLDIYCVYNSTLTALQGMSIRGGCSGVYLDYNGTILTAAHCLSNSELVTVASVTATTYFGDTYEVTLVTTSPESDLALLIASEKQENPDFKYARVYQGWRLKAAQDVLAIGHPVGLFWTVTTGIISHVDRVAFGTGYVQFDAVIAPGSSGGPVFNRYGEILGVVSFYKAGPFGSLTGLNFMVSPRVINTFLHEVKDQKMYKIRNRQYRLEDLK